MEYTLPMPVEPDAVSRSVTEPRVANSSMWLLKVNGPSKLSSPPPRVPSRPDARKPVRR